MVQTYNNPILRGMYPDPSIVLVGDTYYLVNSTFEYYPGIALSKSTDLLNWEKVPSVVTKTSQADLRAAKSNEGIFAVCIRYFNDAFYVITTNFAEFKNFIIRGTLNAAGEIIWDEQRTEIEIMGIDPDLYLEADRTYVEFTGYIDDQGTKAIQQVEIDLTSGAILRGPEVISFGTGGRDVEGPHIIKKNDAYYLLAAEGGTGVGHMITMFKSDNLWGPFEDSGDINPLFTNRDRAEQPLQNIGHADLFQDVKGNWWLTCLGTRPASVGFNQITNLGRETLLYPVIWKQTWPEIYTGVPAQTVDLSAFPQHQESLPNEQTLANFADDFTGIALNPEWITLRDSLGGDLQIKSGLLTLHGRENTFDQHGTPAFLGLRQTEHAERFKVMVAAEHTQLKNGKAGIAVLINSDHFAALFVQAAGDTFEVIRQQKIADLEINESLGMLSELPTAFEIIHRADSKTFKVMTASESLEFTTAALHFSNEAIAALNTGDIQGIYVVNDATLALTAAARSSLT